MRKVEYMNYKDFLKNLLKGDDGKKYKNLLVIFLIGVLLLITASFFKSTTTQTSSNQNIENKQNKDTGGTVAQSEYEKQIRDQLKGILSKIDGVGNVDVMITFESGEEEVPATNSTESSTSSQNDNKNEKNSTSQENKTGSVVVTNEDNGSTKPLILKTNKPKVCSVCVVAEGAEVNLTQLRITKAVMDLLNVNDGKVNVFPMKK